MENKNKTLIIIIIILSIIVIGLGGFIVYDKFINVNKEEETEKVEDNDKESNAENNQNENTNITVNSANCIGVYKGQGAIGQNIMTKEYTNGTITLELYSDGNYKLTKETAPYLAGSYKIEGNKLSLGELPHTCDPSTSDCSEKYVSSLTVNADCTELSNGTGSYFLNSDFTLTKQN